MPPSTGYMQRRPIVIVALTEVYTLIEQLFDNFEFAFTCSVTSSDNRVNLILVGLFPDFRKFGLNILCDGNLFFCSPSYYSEHDIAELV
jgi:hypothetical protein